MANDSPCGDKGCTPVQLLGQEVRKELQHHAEVLSQTAQATTAILKEIQSASAEMRLNIELQNERMRQGAMKFNEVDADIRDLKLLKTQVAILSDRIPSRFGPIAAGGGAGLGLNFIWEFIKAKMMGP